LGNSNGRFGALTRLEEGTIAPLVAIYLSIILLAVIGSVAVITAGVPSQAELSRQVALFLRAAPSAERLVIVSASAQVSADTSTLRLCARYQNPLGIGLNSAIICRESKAKSFLIP